MVDWIFLGLLLCVCFSGVWGKSVLEWRGIGQLVGNRKGGFKVVIAVSRPLLLLKEFFVIGSNANAIRRILVILKRAFNLSLLHDHSLNDWCSW